MENKRKIVGHIEFVENQETTQKKEKEPIIKTSLDLKVTLENKIQRAIYWGRMDSRKEVIERALDEYFEKHSDLIQPLPPKKYD
jgi:hypothetical protein